MTVEQISHLDPTEQELLLRTPALVTILIAGADQNIDKKELNLSEKLVNYRTFTSAEDLHSYYEACNARFESDLAELLEAWNSVTSTGAISVELEKLNDILPKLDGTYAKLLKESWRSMAKKIAEVSGGVFGMGGITKSEARVVDLPMIT